jgi:outer membrane protein TolC
MMHGLRNPKFWALAMVAGLATAPAVAQQPPAAPPAPPPAAPAPAPTPAAPATAIPNQGNVDHYEVGQAVPEVQPGTKMLNLTLEQAMEMALENNLSLKAARLTPQTVDYQLASARAAFMPQLGGTYSYNDRTTLSTDTLDQTSSYFSRQNNYNINIQQTTPWFGGRFSGQFTSGRLFTSNPRQPVNPTLSAGGQFTYTQPLLRGFAIDNARNQVRTLGVQRQVADLQLTTTIENTKASVRTAYWNLRQAIEQIEIQRRSLDLANRLYQDNKTKVDIGTLAPIETTTSETQVANAEQALLQAQTQWVTSELTLKQLIASGPDDDVFKAVTINPVESATLSVQSVDIPAAVQSAIAARTDLVEARRNLDISRMNLEVTHESTRPQLNLQAGYSVSGQNAGIFDEDGNPIGVTGYGAAFNQAFGLDLPTWNLQFNVTYPLFMRAARANYARAQIQLDQSVANLKAQELTVTADVTNAGLAVENSYKQYQAAQKAREVAEKNADAEQTRFDVGMSTNYNVVQAQTNLTTQRLTELQALIRYLNAVAEFDRIQRVGR